MSERIWEMTLREPEDMVSMSRADYLSMKAECEALTAQVAALRVALREAEQNQIVQGRREGIWKCSDCGTESTMRHGIHHDEYCTFSLLSNEDRALGARDGGEHA